MAKKSKKLKTLIEEIEALEAAIKRREYGNVKYTKDGWEMPVDDHKTFEKIVREMGRIRDGKSPDSSRDYIPRPNWDEEKARVENNFLREELDKLRRISASLKGQNTKLKNKITCRDQEIGRLKKRVEDMNNFGREDILDLEE